MSTAFPTTPLTGLPVEAEDHNHNEVPRAFYGDVPPPPPPDDPHWREWPPDEPSRPLSQKNLDDLSDRTVLRWIAVLCVAAMLLHFLVMALVVIIGHPG